MPDEERARERDRGVAEQALLAAAEAVFARRGFSAARLDDIAEEAGYNKVLLFRYIGNKEKVYEAVVGNCLGEVGARMNEFLAPFIANPGAALDRRYVRELLVRSTGWLFDFYVEHPQHLRIVMWEIAEGFRRFTSWPLTPQNVPWRDAALAVLERARHSGIVRRDLDPIALITTVMGMSLIYLTSLPRYTKLFPGHDFASPEALAHAREQMIALVVHGAMTCPEGEEHADRV
jgi:TetR/AcrR family transcriptional regulator